MLLPHADKRQCFAWVNVKGDVIDGARHTVERIELDRQVFYLKEGYDRFTNQLHSKTSEQGTVRRRGKQSCPRPWCSPCLHIPKPGDMDIEAASWTHL